MKYLSQFITTYPREVEPNGQTLQNILEPGLPPSSSQNLAASALSDSSERVDRGLQFDAEMDVAYKMISEVICSISPTNKANRWEYF